MSATQNTIHFDAMAVHLTGSMAAQSLDTGYGANELHPMDQDVSTTADVAFRSLVVGGSPYFTLVECHLH
jgi:hypothetical protein